MNKQSQPVSKHAARPIQKRAEKTRNQVIDAVIACLDTFGYADTSINAIQARAGVSRGSMTHHFPTRHAMIFAAAQHLLDNALAGVQLYLNRLQDADPDNSEYDVILRFWSNILNTAEGRAFIEVMMAARTDSELRSVLSQKIEKWEADIRHVMEQNYGSNAAQIGDLWDMSRTFLQGLLLQTQVSSDPRAMERKITLFATLLGEQTLKPGRLKRV